MIEKGRFLDSEYDDGVYYPSNGNSPIPNFLEILRRHEVEVDRVELERKRAKQYKREAEVDRVAANYYRNRADALAAKLRELGIDPELITPS